ncbi:hypothetical protein AB0F11_19515 [Streptomyces sp. NPDC032472]|uniref:hypothetical protein n=1 Tax=Streptomyces sp. NPDC032472 TaxID=3155018 RepID=UPI0033C18F3F
MTAADRTEGPAAASQGNAAHDGGIQNITHGGNVFNTTVYPPDAGRRARRLSGRSLALTIAATTVIAVSAAILALQYGPLKTANAGGAGPSAPASPSSAPLAPPGGSAAPSAAQPSGSVSPSAEIAEQAGAAGAGGAQPAPATGPTRRSATPSSPYPAAQSVACATKWFSTTMQNVDMQPCTQAVSGTGAVQFGVMVRNMSTAQAVVTVSVGPVVTGVQGSCPMHPEPWREVVIDPGQTWYSQLGQCSVSEGVKGHRVQSSGRVVPASAGDTELANATLRYSRSFDISTNGTAKAAY